MATLGPNESCHCGSGRRYKRCCSLRDRAARKRSRAIGGVVVVVLVLAGLAVALEIARRKAPSTDSAYKYDAVNNRYWHTEHGHWHDGPPPDIDVSQLDPASLPEPWHYDAEAHRHWHPDHQHWHDGFPPAGQGNVVPLPGLRPDSLPTPAPPPPPAPATSDPGESLQE